MTIAPFLPVILIGGFRIDYIISPKGEAFNHVPGGHLFYSAIGQQFSDRQFGLISRVGRDYPEAFLASLSALGIDLRGVKRAIEAFDQRFFIHYDANHEKDYAHPLAHFASERLPLPKALLGYEFRQPTFSQLTLRSDETIIPRDIPPDYLDATMIHLCPQDFLTHTIIPQEFRQQGAKRITLRVNPDYMIPQFLPKIESLVGGLHVLFCDESDLQSLFSNSPIRELPDQLRTICGIGVDAAAVFRNDDVYLHDQRRGEALKIPTGFGKAENRTGLKDAFCGGMVGVLAKTYQFAPALAGGVAAASVVAESPDPLFAFESISGLFDARAKHLLSSVEKVVPVKPPRKWRRSPTR